MRSEPSPSHLFTSRIAFKCQTMLTYPANRKSGAPDIYRSLRVTSELFVHVVSTHCPQNPAYSLRRNRQNLSKAILGKALPL